MPTSDRDKKAMVAIFGLGKKPPQDDGEPDGDENSETGEGDADFDDAWQEYADAMSKRDDAAACDAMKAMIDIRIESSKAGRY